MNEPFRTLIADDEPLGRAGLLSLLQADPELQVVATCSDGGAACENLQLLSPDIAFMDVQMPIFDGLTVIRQIPVERRPATVLVTASDSYAIAAFDVSAVDYLVKPFQESRFRQAVSRAKAAASARRAATARSLATECSTRLAFKVAKGYLLLDQRDIIWIEAAGDGVRLSESHEIHAVHEPLQKVERRLLPGLFLRVHRSFLINPARVRRIVPLFYGEHELLMSDGAKIRVGRSFRDQLKILLASPSKQ